ncbi:MAG: PilN domain-containing protein, partial [Geminicoccaceae bacterium]
MADLLSFAWHTPANFFSWWLGELAGLLPRWMRGTPTVAKNGLILSLGHGPAVLLERTARRGEKEIDRLNDQGSAELSGSLAALTARRYRKWPVIIRLSDELGLRKIVELPAAARSDLGQLLHFELDRLTPFNADDVCFAWRMLDTDASKGRMQVELEIAPKEVVENGLRLIGDHGREVERVELGDDRNREPLNLLPRTAIVQEDGHGWTRRFLRLVVLALLVTAAVIPLYKQHQLVNQLEEEIAVVRAEAEESLVMRERLDGVAKEANFLTETKTSSAAMTDVLAELTRLIPDDSYIVQLRVKDSKIEISGLAQKASDLIAILDRSTILTSPQFRSPVTRDARSGKE